MYAQSLLQDSSSDRGWYGMRTVDRDWNALCTADPFVGERREMFGAYANGGIGLVHVGTDASAPVAIADSIAIVVVAKDTVGFVHIVYYAEKPGNLVPDSLSDNGAWTSP